MTKQSIIVLTLCLILFGCAVQPPRLSNEDTKQQVMATERAFAKTMAERDHTAFATFIADEAIFFSGSKPLRGKQKIVEAWAGFFEKPNPPFSWEPEDVEVLESGNLALSSGPVRDLNGNIIAKYNSIWRRTSSNTWEIIFDKGSEVCNCKIEETP